ncbi:MAG: RNA polymerase sigma factor (TIGR02999 family) [Planctomycetota bacterium]|jgi:RNA polymerase sigma factor (TIGR02999 family)
MTTSTDVSKMLERCRTGDAEALDQLLPLVYEDLRQRARLHLADERRAHTLQPTALVHEAYLNLVKQESRHWENRRHFLALAATAMRRVLLHHAEKRTAEKRGGGRKQITLLDCTGTMEEPDENLIDLDESLTKLSLFDERAARVIELRFFGSLELEEIARILDISTRTAERDWRVARAWLAKDLESNDQ